MPHGWKDYTMPITIEAVTVETLPVDIKAQTIAALKIDIAAQTLPQLNVNLAASAITLNVNIASQAVDINVKTSTGANIVIDKLTQAAYTERQSTLSNRGTSATWTSAVGSSRFGKYFPRGARGFLYSVGVYCRDAGTAGGTITVYISPFPGLGSVASASITVPAAGGEAWRYANFKLMWNYDSLFIYAVGSSSDMEFAYDEGEPWDAYLSTDNGATWTFYSWRFWFQPYVTGETVGDIPVSGSLNVVPLPTVASYGSGVGDITVPSAETTMLFTITGPGKLLGMELYITYNNSNWLISVDGVRLRWLGRDYLNPLEWFDRVGENTGEGVVLVKYDTANYRFTFRITEQIEWKRELKVEVLQVSGANQTARATARYLKMT